MNIRIQNLRKQKGLSQEALADLMGLSRQAIGKWESGATAPSIDNLRELSKILDTTVDYLLTGEQPPEQALPETAVPPEPPQEHRPLFSRALVIFCVAASLVLLWFYMEFSRQINFLQNSYTTISTQVDNLDYFHKADIAALQGAMTSAAPAQEPLLTDYTCTPGDYDQDSDTALIALTAVPRVMSGSANLKFLLLPTEGPSVTVDAESSGGVYTAEVPMPLARDISVYVMVEQAGVLETELLTTLYDFAGQYRCSLSAELDTFKVVWENDGLVALHGRPAVTVRPASSEAGPVPVKLTCTLYVDDTAVYTEDFNMDIFSPTQENSGMAAAIETTCYPGSGEYGAHPHDSNPEVSWKFILTDSLGNTLEETLGW